MKKKIIIAIICLTLIMNVLPSKNTVLSVQAGMVTKNSFSIDTSEYDVIWYPSDLRPVYGSIEGKKQQIIGYLFLVCGVAIDKTDRKQQTLLIKTETQPLLDYKSANSCYYFDTLNDYVAATMHYSKEVVDVATYFPQAKPVSGSKTNGVEISGSFGKEKSLGIVLSQSYTIPTGGLTFSVSKNNANMTRKIIYDYNIDKSFFAINNQSNKALRNCFIQTFSFDYEYRGSKTVPVNTVELSVGFCAGRHLDKPGYSYGGNGAAIEGTGSAFVYSFSLGGY